MPGWQVAHTGLAYWALTCCSTRWSSGLRHRSLGRCRELVAGEQRNFDGESSVRDGPTQELLGLADAVENGVLVHVHPRGGFEVAPVRLQQHPQSLPEPGG